MNIENILVKGIKNNIKGKAKLQTDMSEIQSII